MSETKLSSKKLFPYISQYEREKLSTTLEDISRNSMIRSEVICKRDMGKTVETACREVAADFNLSDTRIRDIYYERKG